MIVTVSIPDSDLYFLANKVLKVPFSVVKEIHNKTEKN